MKACKPYFINLALTGVIPTKAMTPHVPVTPKEITADAHNAINLGVQMLHLHARDEHQNQSSKPMDYGRLIHEIRELENGEDTILCVTTSGRSDPSYETRCKVLDLSDDIKPDMASLTLSSLNFVQSASVNSPTTIRKLAEHMQKRGIKPELEVFDLGMANFVGVLAKEGLIAPPYYVNVLLGNISGGQASMLELSAILSALPKESIVAVAGLGKFQLTANNMGILFTDGIRVGLEDNIWFDQNKKIQATNSSLISRIKVLADAHERPLLTRTELRTCLKITR
ncbi:3-keto-5-aminohexanoate cleavage enzyme [Alteromonas sp. KUL156]|nr:3-keto-5-aminohexanoate cleavage enzyme [Alteromonas sp. KUL154]GFE01250.1 3-keto-5-aminohexanoate cleavage enzyme [Alteromonas sp. KUL156]